MLKNFLINLGKTSFSFTKRNLINMQKFYLTIGSRKPIKTISQKLNEIADNDENDVEVVSKTKRKSRKNEEIDSKNSEEILKSKKKAIINQSDEKELKQEKIEKTEKKKSREKHKKDKKEEENQEEENLDDLKKKKNKSKNSSLSSSSETFEEKQPKISNERKSKEKDKMNITNLEENIELKKSKRNSKKTHNNLKNEKEKDDPSIDKTFCDELINNKDDIGNKKSGNKISFLEDGKEIKSKEKEKKINIIRDEVIKNNLTAEKYANDEDSNEDNLVEKKSKFINEIKRIMINIDKIKKDSIIKDNNEKENRKEKPSNNNNFEKTEYTSIKNKNKIPDMEIIMSQTLKFFDFEMKKDEFNQNSSIAKKENEQNRLDDTILENLNDFKSNILNRTDNKECLLQLKVESFHNFLKKFCEENLNLLNDFNSNSKINYPKKEIFLIKTYSTKSAEQNTRNQIQYECLDILKVLTFKISINLINEIKHRFSSLINSNSRILLYFDGGCSTDYNIGTCGIHGTVNDKTFFEAYFNIGFNSSNNTAEYMAMIFGLYILSLLETNIPIKIIGDSQLVIRIMNKIYKPKTFNIIVLDQISREIVKKINNYEFVSVLRELNRNADRLSNLAKDLKTGEIKIIV